MLGEVGEEEVEVAEAIDGVATSRLRAEEVAEHEAVGRVLEAGQAAGVLRQEVVVSDGGSCVGG